MRRGRRAVEITAGLDARQIRFWTRTYTEKKVTTESIVSMSVLYLLYQAEFIKICEISIPLQYKGPNCGRQRLCGLHFGLNIGFGPMDTKAALSTKRLGQHTSSAILDSTQVFTYP
jgi:hypothetical protein